MIRDELAAVLAGLLKAISAKISEAERSAHYSESPLDIVRTVFNEVADQLVEDGLP